MTGYHGGESLKPFSTIPGTDGYFDPVRLAPNSASIFAMLEPAGSLRGPNPVSLSHDIRGRFDAALVEGRLSEATRIAVDSKPHHPSALFYAHLFNWDRLRTVGPDDADYFKVGGAALPQTPWLKGLRPFYSMFSLLLYSNPTMPSTD